MEQVERGPPTSAYRKRNPAKGQGAGFLFFFKRPRRKRPLTPSRLQVPRGYGYRRPRERDLALCLLPDARNDLPAEQLDRLEVVVTCVLEHDPRDSRRLELL